MRQLPSAEPRVGGAGLRRAPLVRRVPRSRAALPSLVRLVVHASRAGVAPPRLARLVAPALLAAALILASGGAEAGMDDWLLFQGLATGEVHQTDDDSVLLSMNQGDPASVRDLVLWQALRLGPSLHLFAMEELSAETGSGEGAETTLEMALVRYTARSAHPFSLEAGRVTTPIGSFPGRHLADVNPLIGEPAGYDTEYPLGIVFSGAFSKVDWLASVISLPLRDGRAMPEADDAPRPALSAGVTPFAGFRLGAYATWGPYLGEEVEDELPAGSRWRDYDQQVLGLELHFTRGYFVLNGEFNISSYEAPFHAADVHGRAWYLEGRYTLTPRLFTALRVEQSVYPYILPVAPGNWRARPINLWDAEAGIGYRITPDTLVKASIRRDMWPLRDSIEPFYPDGYAVSLQLSQRFDVISWFDRRP